MCEERNWLGFSMRAENVLVLVCVAEIYMVSYAGRQLLGSSVSIEVDLVFVLVVKMDLMSVWEMELDLISV